MRLPSVIALKEYHADRRAGRPSPGSTCSCATDSPASIARADVPTEHLTFDHVVPRSRGGRTTWHNVVAACQRLQPEKGQPPAPAKPACIPRMRPTQPTTFQLQENGRAFPPNYLHESWRDFLYWDTPLDPTEAGYSQVGAFAAMLRGSSSRAPRLKYRFAIQDALLRREHASLKARTAQSQAGPSEPRRQPDGQARPGLDRLGQRPVGGRLARGVGQRGVAVLDLLAAEFLDGVAQRGLVLAQRLGLAADNARR